MPVITKFMQEVDFNRIKQEKVKSFINLHGLRSSLGFTKLRPECFDAAMESTYLVHHEVFVINRDIDVVWETYKTIHPKEAWNGNMVSFGLQYSRRKDEITYLEDRYTGMEPGQVIILHLRLLRGLLTIAVAHEVMDVNDAEKTIKLCYIKGGASVGSQWITLTRRAEGITEVSHKTYYKSKSPFRDKTLYPPLHTKAISEFHKNVKEKAERM